MSRNAVYGWVLAAATLAVGYTVASVVVARRQAARHPAPQIVQTEPRADHEAAGSQAAGVSAPLVEPAPAEQVAPEPITASPAAAPQPPSAKGGDRGSAKKQPPAAAGQTPQAPRGAKPPPQDPLARAALSFVGVDPLAEQVWVQAINDPDLPAEERKDLIEDLNEDGFPDPHNPTADDLPLIVSRIVLIEQLAPDAMDEANLAAFEEAYKDLLNMYARLTGR